MEAGYFLIYFSRVCIILIHENGPSCNFSLYQVHLLPYVRHMILTLTFLVNTYVIVVMVQSIRIIKIPYFDYKETNDLCQRETTHDCLSIHLSVYITISFRSTNDHYIVLMKPDFVLKKSRTKHDLNIFFHESFNLHHSGPQRSFS